MHVGIRLVEIVTGFEPHSVAAPQLGLIIAPKTIKVKTIKVSGTVSRCNWRIRFLTPLFSRPLRHQIWFATKKSATCLQVEVGLVVAIFHDKGQLA
jgi:hypothetical protein